MTSTFRILAAGCTVAGLFFTATAASAQTAPSLGAAQSFAVLGGSGVTNTGTTVVTGDLGTSPGAAVTGFPPGTVLSGTIHAADAGAAAAQAAVGTAYNALASQPCTQNLTGQDLGGLVLTPGVYCFDSSAQLTGTLTLNSLGDPNAVFIFKIGSTLTTASAASVVVSGGSPCNIFWQVGSSATLGTGSHLIGNVLAQASITVTTAASIMGRALARNGAVTLDTNAVTVACGSGPLPPTCPTITIAPTTLANGRVAAAYSQSLAGGGGTAPYGFVLASGALPAGLTLSPAGALAGTPTAVGQSTFSIRATDANACSVSPSFTLVVAAALPVCPDIVLAPTTLPNGRVAVAYSQSLTASGGTGPYTFAATGTLPAGLTLSSAGALTGTPTTVGPSTFSIRATDANACVAGPSYTIVIAAPQPPGCPDLTLAPSTLPSGRVAVAYTQSLTVSGGTAPYTFSAVGTLPAGLTLSAAGALTGTPTTAGSTTFAIAGTDASACSVSVPFTVLVAAAITAPPSCPVITIAPSPLPNGVVGVAYSQALAASGGTGPYSFGVTVGTLPAGMTLTAAGVLAGTPTAASQSTLTIRATDANACLADVPYTLSIATDVPALPQVFMLLLALMLMAGGYVQVRRRTRQA